jgi:hypothetical protein
LATLATARTDGLLADGVSNASALNSGYHLAYLIGAALVALAIVVAVVVLRVEESSAEQQADSSQAGGAAAEPAYSEVA